MANKQGLDKKMTFGKHDGITPKEIINKGQGHYINYMTNNKDFYFTPETYRYLETFDKIEFELKKCPSIIQNYVKNLEKQLNKK